MYIRQGHNHKFISGEGFPRPFNPFSSPLPSFRFSLFRRPRSGPSNPVKEFGRALLTPSSGGERHLQPPDTSSWISASVSTDFMALYKCCYYYYKCTKNAYGLAPVCILLSRIIWRCLRIYASCYSTLCHIQRSLSRLDSVCCV